MAKNKNEKNVTTTNAPAPAETPAPVKMVQVSTLLPSGIQGYERSAILSELPEGVIEKRGAGKTGGFWILETAVPALQIAAEAFFSAKEKRMSERAAPVTRPVVEIKVQQPTEGQVPDGVSISFSVDNLESGTFFSSRLFGYASANGEAISASVDGEARLALVGLSDRDGFDALVSAQQIKADILVRSTLQELAAGLSSLVADLIADASKLEAPAKRERAAKVEKIGVREAEKRAAIFAAKVQIFNAYTAPLAGLPTVSENPEIAEAVHPEIFALLTSENADPNEIVRLGRVYQERAAIEAEEAAKVAAEIAEGIANLETPADSGAVLAA